MPCQCLAGQRRAFELCVFESMPKEACGKRMLVWIFEDVWFVWLSIGSWEDRTLVRPDTRTGAVLIRLRWIDFPLQSENGKDTNWVQSGSCRRHFTATVAPATWDTARSRQNSRGSGLTVVGHVWAAGNGKLYRPLWGRWERTCCRERTSCRDSPLWRSLINSSGYCVGMSAN